MTVYSNLKYDHPFSANATGLGALTKISSQTASNSSSLSFTTGIDSTYDEYIFKCINMHPSTDTAEFTFNLSTDGGSNYNVTKTTSAFRALHDEADSQTSLSYQTASDLAQSTGYQTLCQYVGNDSDQSCTANLILFSPSSTTFVKHFIASNNSYYANDKTNNDFIAGYGNTTSAINAIDFKFSSGNIDSGTIIMYGVS